MLENTFLRDTQLFLYPLALVKLALFIMTCYKVRAIHQYCWLKRSRVPVYLKLLFRRDMQRQSINPLSFQSRTQRRRQTWWWQSPTRRAIATERESKSYSLFWEFCSNFGNRFRNVVNTLGLKTNHEGFDTNMIEMKSTDWPNFIQELAQLGTENIWLVRQILNAV